MVKEQPVHLDRLSRRVDVGDIIAVAYSSVAYSNGLMLAKVTKLTKKMIKIQRFPKPFHNGETRNKYAHDAIKLDPDDIAIYILQGGE